MLRVLRSAANLPARGNNGLGWAEAGVSVTNLDRIGRDAGKCPHSICVGSVSSLAIGRDSYCERLAHVGFRPALPPDHPTILTAHFQGKGDVANAWRVSYALVTGMMGIMPVDDALERPGPCAPEIGGRVLGEGGDGKAAANDNRDDEPHGLLFREKEGSGGLIRRPAMQGPPQGDCGPVPQRQALSVAQAPVQGTPSPDVRSRS